MTRQAPPRRRSRCRPPPKRSCAPAPTFVIHVVPSASGVWRGRGTFSGARPLAMASHARARSQHSGSSHSNAHCDEPFHSSCQDGSRASRAWVPPRAGRQAAREVGDAQMHNGAQVTRVRLLSCGRTMQTRARCERASPGNIPRDIRGASRAAWQQPASVRRSNLAARWRSTPPHNWDGGAALGSARRRRCDSPG